MREILCLNLLKFHYFYTLDHNFKQIILQLINTVKLYQNYVLMNESYLTHLREDAEQ